MIRIRNLFASMRDVASKLHEAGGLDGLRGLGREDFRVELAELGLLGREFALGEYLECLASRLGWRIWVEVVKDSAAEALSEELSKEGNLAEVLVAPDRREAVVLVRESLECQPWPAYEMALYHELSHLAAEHHATTGSGRRFVAPNDSGFRGVDRLKREAREAEARRRATWLLLASRCPEVLEREGAYRVSWMGSSEAA